MRIRRAPTTPGEILQEEFLKPLGMTEAQLAAHRGCDVKVINRIVNGRSAVTAEMVFRNALVLQLPDQALQGSRLPLADP